MRLCGALFALISTVLSAQEALNQGIAAFQSGRYQQAVEFFQEEVAAHPNSVNGHLYLGTSYVSMWIPWASPENAAKALSAETEFRRVLELDGKNATAMESMASLAYNSRKPDEALDWYERLAATDPTNKEAPYSIAVIAWAKWYPALRAARARLPTKPETPGPLPSPVRQQLKAQYSSMIEKGIADLDRAIALDSHYCDAMAQMNLLIRDRADLRDTREGYVADIALADEWDQKSLRAQEGQPLSRTQIGGVRVVGMTGMVRTFTYRAPGFQWVRASGTVRFRLTIGEDGRPQNLQLLSGHPLLVAYARDAFTRCVYEPTVHNGNPAEVATQVDVIFP